MKIMEQVFGSTNRFVEALIEENKLLRTIVEAADKYDRCTGSYPALRLALNKWRKAEKARQPESEDKNDT